MKLVPPLWDFAGPVPAPGHGPDAMASIATKQFRSWMAGLDQRTGGQPNQDASLSGERPGIKVYDLHGLQNSTEECS